MHRPLCFGASIILLLCVRTAALACLLVGPLRLDGYPRDGAEGVPLDAVPIYHLTRGELPSAITLLPADVGVPLNAGLPFPPLAPNPLPEVHLSYEDGGGDVAVSVREAQGGYFEIAPVVPLLPHTRYTLNVSWSERERLGGLTGSPTVENHEALSFRTGDAAYAGDLGAPAVFATQFVGEVGTSCDPPPYAICFSLSDDEALYLAHFEGEPLTTLERGSFFSNRLVSDLADGPDCMHIRRRAPNGTLSEEVVSCRAERTVYDLSLLPESDQDQIGIHCESAGLRWGKQLVSDRFGAASAPTQAEAAPDAPVDVEVAPATEDEGSGPEARRNGGCGLAPGRSADNALSLAFALSLGLWLCARSRRT